MKYTKEWLWKLGACEASREWASKNLKEGTVITADLLRELPVHLWAWWLACQLDGDNILVWKAASIAFREAAKAHPSLLPFSGNVNHENCEAAMNAATDADDSASANAREDAINADAHYSAMYVARYAYKAADAARDAAHYAAGFAAYVAAYVAWFDTQSNCHRDRDYKQILHNAQAVARDRIRLELDRIAIRWLVENKFIQGE